MHAQRLMAILQVHSPMATQIVTVIEDVHIIFAPSGSFDSVLTHS